MFGARHDDKDILPAIKGDSSYLKKREFEIIDHQGNVIAASSLDWSRYSGGQGVGRTHGSCAAA